MNLNERVAEILSDLESYNTRNGMMIYQKARQLILDLSASNKAKDEALKFYADSRWEDGIPYKEPILPPMRSITKEEAETGIIIEKLVMADKIDTGQIAKAALGK